MRVCVTVRASACVGLVIKGIRYLFSQEPCSGKIGLIDLFSLFFTFFCERNFNLSITWKFERNLASSFKIWRVKCNRCRHIYNVVKTNGANVRIKTVLFTKCIDRYI